MIVNQAGKNVVVELPLVELKLLRRLREEKLIPFLPEATKLGSCECYEMRFDERWPEFVDSIISRLQKQSDDELAALQQAALNGHKRKLPDDLYYLANFVSHFADYLISNQSPLKNLAGLSLTKYDQAAEEERELNGQAIALNHAEVIHKLWKTNHVAQGENQLW